MSLRYGADFRRSRLVRLAEGRCADSGERRGAGEHEQRVSRRAGRPHRQVQEPHRRPPSLQPPDQGISSNHPVLKQLNSALSCSPTTFFLKI